MRSRLIVTVVAVVLGVTAALIAGRYLQAQQARISQGAQLATVLVAAQDLPAGMTSDELLSRGYLIARDIPRQYVAGSAISSRSELQGKVTAEAISKDEQITSAMFKYPAEVGLASSTPKGYLAMSIPYEAARGVGGLLRPGDSVAVYGTFEPGQNGVSGAVTKMILSKVKVLAVGQALDAATAESSSRSSQNQQSGLLSGTGLTSQQGATLTLAVTPQDAEKLVFAQEEGKVWLALFSPTDPTTPTTRGVRLSQTIR